MQKKALALYLLAVSGALILSGCVVRTYPLTRDRIDQDLYSGNRGYLMGQAPSAEEKERRATRTTQIVEVELGSPLRFERRSSAKSMEELEASKPEVNTEEKSEVWGNQGYTTQSVSPEINEAAPENIEKYTVQKGDTLQKISQKLYGTTKKWTKIFDLNKETLKAPNKIYPGQVINVPAAEPLKETKDNLK